MLNSGISVESEEMKVFIFFVVLTCMILEICSKTKFGACSFYKKYNWK